jgi:hypothetical protein
MDMYLLIMIHVGFVDAGEDEKRKKEYKNYGK